MYKTDQFIYIQMQKTACTHIAQLLSKLFPGEQIGKHNAAMEADLALDPYFISSIRNPWDWYLSLWTFGVQGNGGLRNRLTKRRFYRSLKSAIRAPKRNFSDPINAILKDVYLWRKLYESSDNVESFRAWLNQIHSPKNSHFLGEGYGDTAIVNLCGFMTYRYLYLCCRNVDDLKNSRSISNYHDVVRFESRNCYINFFIRQESLEDDLCEALEKIRPLTQNERDLIYGAQKTNISKRTCLISDYYDNESIELVRNRERLVIEKFDYSSPQISSNVKMTNN